MTEPEECLLFAKVVEGRDTNPLITCRADRRPPSVRLTRRPEESQWSRSSGDEMPSKSAAKTPAQIRSSALLFLSTRLKESRCCLSHPLLHGTPPRWGQLMPSPEASVAAQGDLARRRPAGGRSSGGEGHEPAHHVPR